MYQALYREYRPQTFDEILGQDHITTTLKHQVANNNFSHAYLFSGTRGTGKTTAAKVLSRAINCLNQREGNPCNECENCMAILEETTMDVIEMDAASNNGVDNIRDIRDKVVYPPSKLKYRVYIIDEVHMLSKGAFNALLKTLEEPPKHLVFILATTEKEKLPQTIVSRCQRFDFKRVSTNDIVKNMKVISEKLDIQIDDKALNLIARSAEGGMRDALSLLDQCISYGEKIIKYEDAINILGIANKDLLFKLVDNIISKDIEEVLKMVDGIIQEGKDINQFIIDLINHIRDLLIIRTSKNAQDILESPDIKQLSEQSKNVDASFYLNALDILTEAANKAKWSTQPRIILEVALINILNMESISLLERVKRLEEKINNAPETTLPPKTKVETVKKDEPKKEEEKNPVAKEETKEEKTKEASSTLGYNEVNLDIIAEEWPKILQNLKKENIRIYAFMVEGEVLDYENNRVTIGYDDNFSFHKDAVNNSQENKETVEKVISNHFKTEMTINLLMKNCFQKKNSKLDSNIDEEIKKVQDFFGKDIVKII